MPGRCPVEQARFSSSDYCTEKRDYHGGKKTEMIYFSVISGVIQRDGDNGIYYSVCERNTANKKCYSMSVT